MNKRPTILADVIFEDNSFPDTTIHYQTNREFEDGFTLNPNAFFLACALPAMRGGEKRIKMEAEVCPILIEGVTVAIKCLIGWYNGNRVLPNFEVGVAKDTQFKSPDRAGSFLSGGVDSLATLRHNRLLYSDTHPASFKDSFYIYGSADIGVGNKDELDVYERGYRNLEEVAAEVGLTIIPVYTNVRDLALLFPLNFYVLEYHSCMLASVAQAFAERVNMVTINSAYDITNLKPFGTHPLLDLHYSSQHLRIRHGSAQISRKERVALIGDWQFGLDRIRTCLSNKDSLLNCGKCWKCLMTQAELLAIGKLAQSKAFPKNDLSKQDLLNQRLIFELQRESYLDLIEDFDRIGRHDLTNAIISIVRKYDHRNKFLTKRILKLKEVVRSMDRKLLGSRLVTAKRAIYQLM